MRTYCNYHVHSDYSNVFFPDSPIKKEDYAKRATELGHKILSSCEHGYAGNHFHVYDIAKKNGLKFVFAAELYWVKDRFVEYEKNGKTQRDRTNNHIVLIAKTEEGRRQINALYSEANDTGYFYRPRCDINMLMGLDPSDVMVTTACAAFYGYGIAETREIIMKLWRHFGTSFYLEVQANLIERQREVNNMALSLYREYGIPLIAATDSHFIYPEQAQTRLDLQNSTVKFKDDDDGGELFMDYPDGDTLFARFVEQNVLPEAVIDEAITNTNIISTFAEFDFYENRTRKIPNPYRLDHPEYTIEQRREIYLDLIRKAWLKYRDTVPRERWDEYTAAIKYEIDTMLEGGVSDYALLDYRIVELGKQNGGIVSRSGRGSGPSYFTNTLLGFSTMDRLSLPVKLYPDRFVSLPRLLAGQLPDLDLNVANRTPFIEAQKEIVGVEHAYPMIAFSEAKKKSAWKMYCRAYNASLSEPEEQIESSTMSVISEQLEHYDYAIKEKDEDEEIDIADFVSPQYLPLYEKSKVFGKLVVGKTVHPCAILVYDGSIREEIGLIRAKSDNGKLDEMVTVIDGVTADSYGYVKNDILKVAVYDLINRVYSEIGRPIPTTNELLEMVRTDNQTWAVFSKGMCCGVNQCERPTTKQRLMRYSPKNLSELSAFVAAIRPGFKSNLETFLSRTNFAYGISEFDNLIRTPQMPYSFILYQENIMAALAYAGFPQTECYVTLKHISKKHPEEIEKIKPRFIDGFTKALGESAHTPLSTAEKVWQIISDASSYSFNASHSTAVAFDALYIAWAKAHYPLETHRAMLEVYSSGSDKKRLTSIKAEMYTGFGVKLLPAKYGDDNTCYTISREQNAIRDSLIGIPYMNKVAASQLANKSKYFPSWTQLMVYLAENTSVNLRQMKTLISLDYFKDYGGIDKLQRLYSEFRCGTNKYSTKYVDTTKLKRITALIELETSIIDSQTDPYILAQNEVQILGFPIGIFDVPHDVYIITEIDAKYSAKVTLYSLKRGTSGTLKMRKQEYKEVGYRVGDVIRITDWQEKPKYKFNGQGVKPTRIPGAFERWIIYPKIVRRMPGMESETEQPEMAIDDTTQSATA